MRVKMSEHSDGGVERHRRELGQPGQGDEPVCELAALGDYTGSTVAVDIGMTYKMESSGKTSIGHVVWDCKD